MIKCSQDSQKKWNAPVSGPPLSMPASQFILWWTVPPPPRLNSTALRHAFLKAFSWTFSIFLVQQGSWFFSFIFQECFSPAQPNGYLTSSPLQSSCRWSYLAFSTTQLNFFHKLICCVYKQNKHWHTFPTSCLWPINTWHFKFPVHCTRAEFGHKQLRQFSVQIRTFLIMVNLDVRHLHFICMWNDCSNGNYSIQFHQGGKAFRCINLFRLHDIVLLIVVLLYCHNNVLLKSSK